MLETVLAIAGKPGLYRLVSRGNKNLIVESLDAAKKRTPIFGTDKVISLGDIAMYTEGGEVALKKVLQSVANKENGIVIGTGDLSELALGWCTYNGDHMSMYSVNASIPKTLVRHLVNWVKEQEQGKIKEILEDILNTPISPELLPPDKAGNILQKTESTIGPYVLHDFFLYHFLRYGATPKKLQLLAEHTFKDFTKEEIKKWLKVFIKRFFTQQFKRNCVPDGVKVGSISLSPRGDLRMPSDIELEAWLKEIE